MELMSSATNRPTAFKTKFTVAMTVNLLHSPPAKKSHHDWRFICVKKKKKRQKTHVKKLKHLLNVQNNNLQYASKNLEKCHSPDRASLLIWWNVMFSARPLSRLRSDQSNHSVSLAYVNITRQEFPKACCVTRLTLIWRLSTRFRMVQTGALITEQPHLSNVTAFFNIYLWDLLHYVNSSQKNIICSSVFENINIFYVYVMCIYVI